MSALSPASAEAIARLRTYVPPPSNYYRLPLVRRAAVLILLFAGRDGELKVVLTARANTLKSYSGQVALPGGKADDLAETAWQTSRREAFEEIGLPLTDAGLPAGFRVEHLCQLPSHLARTELGVRPTVAFLSATSPSSPMGTFASPSADPSSSMPVTAPSIEDTLIPRLDAKEVAAVFTAPFRSFLYAKAITSDAQPATVSVQDPKAPASANANDASGPQDWYTGIWTTWHNTRWRMHNFYVPVPSSAVARPRPDPKRPRSPARGSPSPIPYGFHREDPPEPTRVVVQDPKMTSVFGRAAKREEESIFRVFGMTARILVDCARVAYGIEPDFEHNEHHGDETLIARLLEAGRLGETRKQEEFEDRREDVAAAAKI